MDDLAQAQTLLGSVGAFVVALLMQFLRPVWSGIAPENWESRAIPIIVLVFSALWQVVVVNVLRDLGQPVTFTWWILVYLTIFCALSSAGLYSATKTLAGR